MKFAIRTFDGKYISAQDNVLINKKYKLQCNRTHIGEWEQYTLYLTENNTIAIQTHLGYFISAQKNGYLNCNRKTIGEWEKFQLIKNNDNTISLKTCHGTFFSIFKNMFSNYLIANKKKIGINEKFYIINNNKICFIKTKREQNFEVEKKKKEEEKKQLQQMKLELRAEYYSIQQMRLVEVRKIQQLKQELEEEREKIELELKEKIEKIELELKEERIQQMKEEDECPICCEEITDKKTTSCGHSFCRGCIRQWCNNKNNCPLCRQNLSNEII